MSLPATVDNRLTQPDTPAFALGLGLTNECNLACSFCYRDPSRVDRLTLEQVRSVMQRIPVRSVNLGTGENGLHPEFLPILGYLRAQPIKLTMTTNGYSVASIADADLAAFKDLEFSLDYPTEAEQDHQRGPGNWQLLHDQATRCRRLGVPVTFIAVMMQSNFDRLADIAAIAKAYDAPTSLLSPTSSIGPGSSGCSSAPMSSLSVNHWCAPWPVCLRAAVVVAWRR
jgi:MoaA/NifB/PqqE/SkfB family radical SAM enzyme